MEMDNPSQPQLQTPRAPSLSYSSMRRLLRQPHS